MGYVDVGSKYSSEWRRMTQMLNLPHSVTDHPYFIDRAQQRFTAAQAQFLLDQASFNRW